MLALSLEQIESDQALIPPMRKVYILQALFSSLQSMYIQRKERVCTDLSSLSSQRTVEQLETSCQQVFASFGACHIKVRLDRNKHPFAFVQFEVRFESSYSFRICWPENQNVDDASAAVEGSLNLNIDGRRIRVERAKAERE
jgi:hypothetical protein